MVGQHRPCLSLKNKSSAKPGQANSLTEDQLNIQRKQSTNWDTVPNFSLESVLLEQAWPGTLRMPQTCCAGTQPRHLSCPLGRPECPPGTAQAQSPSSSHSATSQVHPGSGKCHQKEWKSGKSFKFTVQQNNPKEFRNHHIPSSFSPTTPS